MKIVEGALLREQNDDFAGQSGDSCFDTSELEHMKQALKRKFPYDVWTWALSLPQFIDENKRLQRHPQTKFKDDISSDQMHMFVLATKDTIASFPTHVGWPRTSNGNLFSIGLLAEMMHAPALSNLSLLVQIILFWIPVRWCDGNDPTIRFGPIRLNLGFRHHCGDYRLFKQCLFYAPWILRRLVFKQTLKRMTRLYWAPEPNIQWLIEIDDRFIEECL